MKLRYYPWRYYLQFLCYKFRILADCKAGRIRLLLSQIIHYAGHICHIWWEMPGYNHIEMITTVWGLFQFIGDLYGYLIMDPSFERPDMEYFFGEIRNSLSQKKKVLFLDIGANVGLYTIGLSNTLNKQKLAIHAFEPDPVYHLLLQKNIEINHTPHVTVHRVAIGKEQRVIDANGFQLVKDTVKKTRVKFHIRTLDSIITPAITRNFDVIYVKIDIEGHEEDALRGARQLYRSGKPMLFMIEDCVNPSILTYLKAQKFTSRGKITPYNSYWELNGYGKD